MFYDNFATQNIKLITDKIKETDFNGIKYGSELSDNVSSSKVEIAELESNSGGVKSSDKNLTIIKDKKTDVTVKGCNSKTSDNIQSTIVKGWLDSIEPQGIGGHWAIEKPNPKHVINFEDKKVLIRPKQAVSTKGKKVVLSSEINSDLFHDKIKKPSKVVSQKKKMVWVPKSGKDIKSESQTSVSSTMK